ncbi:MAG: TIGR03862 family flavoprotein [Hyphomicrobiaceae bacterium]|nr:TIGR03862 family flavoprotein [Hyphomicrobiaceae bacterium]
MRDASPAAAAASPAPADQPHVAVVGAGPAGLMAAEAAAGAGCRVTIIERMRSPGRKLLMAGRGGLNLTHSEPFATFVSRYGPAGAEALLPALEAFTPADLVAWAEGLGQPTFVGSSGRVFPRAMKASGLLRQWLVRLAGLDVRLVTGARLAGFGAPADGSSIRLVVGTGEEAREEVAANAVVLALGGASWPRLGSDGRWVELLNEAGASIAPLGPFNAGVVIAWSPVMRERFAGVPLKRIAMTCGSERVRGEAVITASGLEGGVVYALNRAILAPARPDTDASGAASQHSDGGPCWPVLVRVDLRPDVATEAIAARLEAPRGRHSTSDWLRRRLGLSPVEIALLREPGAGALPSTPADLARLIKALPLRVERLAGLDRAISTSGGVMFESLEPTLMLRHRPGLFVAGEMIDWDAPTGGYLLQAAFATGRWAGLGAARWAHLQPERVRQGTRT